MKISKKTFGLLSNGKKVHLYTIKAGDLSLSVSTLGATWTSLKVPSREKGSDDILYGYSTLNGFLSGDKYFGGTIGRFANRIGKAKFSIRNKEYHLTKNEGENILHGGKIGFDKKIWKADAYEEKDGVFLRFELKSKDGEEGFPGELKADVCYGLTKSNEIVCDYKAEVDVPCPVNLTNHAYFNLAGENRGMDILSTEMRLFCPSYLELNKELIPTGKIIPVDGTPFDFRNRKPIGRDFSSLASDGYDHCFVINGQPGSLRPFAEVYEPFTGRTMRGYTTQPAVQLYTANYITSMPGKIGSVYKKHGAFCLETQHFPDSPNHAEFPSAVFGPDRDYHEKAVFAFEWA